MTRQRHSELGFNMSLCVFDKGWGRLLILLLASILQSTLAASQELPDAPSAVMRTSFYGAGDSATSRRSAAIVCPGIYGFESRQIFHSMGQTWASSSG